MSVCACGCGADIGDRINPNTKLPIRFRSGHNTVTHGRCRGGKTDNENRKSYHRAWRAKNKHRERGYALMSRYSMTEDDYDELFDKQSGLCAICRTSGPLVVDHDHTTGQVRGLLCTPCNLALGNVNDCVSVLRAAADYLEGST